MILSIIISSTKSMSDVEYSAAKDLKCNEGCKAWRMGQC